MFPNISKAEIYQIINADFYSDDNIWNEDSTRYHPDGVGCSYSIEELQDTVIVSAYCGC